MIYQYDFTEFEIGTTQHLLKCKDVKPELDKIFPTKKNYTDISVLKTIYENSQHEPACPKCGQHMYFYKVLDEEQCGYCGYKNY